MPLKKPRSPFKIPSAKAADQPATRKMLHLVRDELKSTMRSSIRSLESKMDARFAKMDARLGGIDARFVGIDARFDEVDARLARMELRLEEQNANNRIVLEGLQALWQRQARVDAERDRLEQSSS